MRDRARNALGRWGFLVAAHPWPTLLIALVIAGGSIVWTVLALEFRPDRSNLIDPDLSWNQRWAEYRALFPRWDDFIVVIDGPAGDARVDEVARLVATTLVEKLGDVTAADAGFEASEAGPRLFAIAPHPLFDQTLEDLRRARRITSASTTAGFLGLLPLLVSEEDRAEGEDLLARLDELLGPFIAGLGGGEPDFGFLRPDKPNWKSFITREGSRLRYIKVQFTERGEGIDQFSRNLARLRGTIRQIVENQPLDLEWGVTGVPAIEADETTQSIRDSTVGSIVAFLLITLLMLIVFRGIVVPLLAALALLIGIAWSFGWLMLSVGHLQLLSVIFAIILLGLGIDFAQHVIARLELVRDEHDDLPSAMSRVFWGIGPGLVTGAVATATAFAATAFTNFTGMKEMGIIAGGGIILCLVAVLSTFPALLAATGRWKSFIRHRPGGETAHFARGALDTVDFHPKLTLAVAAIAVTLLALPGLAVRYDPDVLNLHPEGEESVEWERRIVEDDAESVWAAIVQTKDIEGVPRLVDELRALPEVMDVGAMGLLYPPDREERAARIAAVRDETVPDVPSPEGLGPVRAQLAAVRGGLIERAAAESDLVAGELRAIAGRLEEALRASAQLSPEVQAERLAKLEAAFASARNALAAWLDEALAPYPPGPSDLPLVLREQFIADDAWLIHVLPAPDADGRSILHPDRLEQFIGAVRTVSADVLGPPVQIYESSKLIKRAYITAAVIAVAAILVLLFLDFRSLGDALSSMLPVTIGFLGAFGLMGLTGVPVNFANIMVLPLIFGIGVGAGVNVVYRWRTEPWGRPAGLSGGTGRGLTLSMVSTLIAFGTMLIAEHRGIRSLGFVMCSGLGVTLLACYLVLPAVLRLRTAHWSDER